MESTAPPQLGVEGDGVGGLGGADLAQDEALEDEGAGAGAVVSIKGKPVDYGSDFVVSARSSLDVQTVCSLQGTVVNWKVSARSHNIELSIRFVPADDAVQKGESPQVEPAVPVSDGVQKTNEASGTFTSPCPGLLIITLNNAYSMLRAKTVNVVCTVKVPDGEEAVQWLNTGCLTVEEWQQAASS